MADTNAPPTDPTSTPSFPFITVAAALGVLFVFLGLMWLAVQGENPLADPRPTDAKAPEPKADAAAKLEEVRARNRAALDGVGAKMSLGEAHGKLLGTLKGPNDKLPFPAPEPPVAAAPKKDEKDKGEPAPAPKKGGS